MAVLDTLAVEDKPFQQQHLSGKSEPVEFNDDLITLSKDDDDDLGKALDNLTPAPSDTTESNCSKSGDASGQKSSGEDFGKVWQESPEDGILSRQSDHVSCEDLLEFACDGPNTRRTRGPRNGEHSDEVRIMMKVLHKQSTSESCIAG